MSKFQRSGAFCAVALLCLILTACGGGGANNPLLTVNGQVVTRGQLDAKLESGPAAKQVLTQMVQQMLVDQYARDNHVNVSDAEVAKKEADIRSKYPPGQFDEILAQQGLTEADVHNILRQQIVIEKAVAPDVKVTNADITSYFDKNHTQLDKPERVRARHILVADEKTAEIVEAQLKKDPSKFPELAKEYSTDPSTKDKGGELGFFGPGTMVASFQNAAFSLPVGKISAPVKSPFGYHIIQVEERDPPVPATLANSRAQIVQILSQQEENQQIPVFLQQLRAKANIDVLDNRYADLFPPPLPPPPSPPPSPPASPPAAAPPAPAASK